MTTPVTHLIKLAVSNIVDIETPLPSSVSNNLPFTLSPTTKAALRISLLSSNAARTLFHSEPPNVSPLTHCIQQQMSHNHTEGNPTLKQFMFQVYNTLSRPCNISHFFHKYKALRNKRQS